MKRVSFLIVLLVCFIAAYAQQKQPRLHNWIAEYLPINNVRDYLRYVMVMSDGTLRSWRPGEQPERFTTIDNAVQVCAGSNHLVILKSDGTVWTMGKNDYLQLGNEGSDYTVRESNVPVKVTGLKDVIDISTWADKSYALLKDGTVWTWGGENAVYYKFKELKRLSRINNIENAIAISGPIALLADGTVWTWGNRNHGGKNSKVPIDPIKIKGITNAIAISSMDGCLALLADGTMKAWGNNFNGQLGNGGKGIIDGKIETTVSYEPVTVLNINNAVDISGDATCLAALKDGTVKGWGWGVLGALGPFSKNVVATPIKVYDLKNVVAIYAGAARGFALQKDGTLLGWGADMVDGKGYRNAKGVIKIASFGSLAPKP
jgi:alpha-tubulin suppressor-like RCC1 family protein